MNHPLVVDLDGTFIHGDMLKKDLKRYIGLSPLRLFRCVFWVIKGRPFLKSKLASLSLIDYLGLKTNQAVLELIYERKRRGALIILMTGTDQKHAQEIAKMFGLFDEVIASSGGTNMVGVKKSGLLVARYGYKGFDYVGNSRQDIPVWKAAAVPYATNLGAFAGFVARFLNIDLHIIDRDVA